MLPSLAELEKVSQEIKNIPNRKKESKRGVHYGLFLLGYQSGLRVNEAISFDLSSRSKQGLYRIEKPKGKKERLVYIPKKVVRELKKNNWKPNQTNRYNFYHFLRKIKRELNIGKNTELTLHTLRRAFTTYHAESGLPLPLLQKLLGHSSIRTTALYWQNIYDDGNNDTADILAGKNWLENRKPVKPPTTENFPEILKIPDPIFTANKPVIKNKITTDYLFPNQNPIHQDNSLSTKKIAQKNTELVGEISRDIAVGQISPKTPGKFFSSRENSFNKRKFFLNNTSKKGDQIETSQPLALTANQEQEPTKKEAILLQKIKDLKKQLDQIQTENKNLTVKLTEKSQELSQSGKEKTKEQQRADQYQQQLKTIAQAFKQWQKINYYQQLEKERNEVAGSTKELEAQIIQPPPFKIKS